MKYKRTPRPNRCRREFSAEQARCRGLTWTALLTSERCPGFGFETCVGAAVTTFAFQPWHSAIEFKRYLHRFMLEFVRIETLAGVKRTVYNQYHSLVLPLQKWLEAHGVALIRDCTVTDLDHQTEDGQFLVTGIHCQRQGKDELITVNDGDLVTFKDSNWLLSIVLAHQPHFPSQRPDVQVFFWGYALFPDRIGNFIAKSMADCTGAQILQELCDHLRFDLETVESAICIPCRMPYITRMFMPRQRGDRPLPVPIGSANFAFVSQFVEIPGDVVFTVEYSVRAAPTAVYQLLGIDCENPPVTPHVRSLRAQLEAMVKAFR